MTKKTEIGLAVGIIALLIIVVIAFMLRQTAGTVIAPVAVREGLRPSPADTASPNAPASAPAPVANPQTAAMIFVERFASYSSESNFANVTDVLPLVTSSLATSIQAVAAEQRAKGVDQAYYGISTKVISQNVKEQTDAAATILVSTQRQEAIGGPTNTTVRYQDITVSLVKEGDAWKVNDFVWAQ